MGSNWIAAQSARQACSQAGSKLDGSKRRRAKSKANRLNKAKTNRRETRLQLAQRMAEYALEIADGAAWAWVLTLDKLKLLDRPKLLDSLRY